jgi:hypothetical protein
MTETGLTFHFEAPLSRREIGATSWYLLTLPPDISADIKEAIQAKDAPWGMITVWATLRDFQWKTILFPRKNEIGYDLAINAKLRKRFRLEHDDVLVIELLVPLNL